VIQTSERLQQLFNKCDQDAVEADFSLDFDDVDEYDVVGEFMGGISKGFELYEKLQEVRKIKGNESAQIFKVTYNCYGDDDGVKLFIGTEDNLAALFEANPGENDEDDEGDD